MNESTYVVCFSMENHNRSKKHLENMSWLRQEMMEDETDQPDEEEEAAGFNVEASQINGEDSVEEPVTTKSR